MANDKYNPKESLGDTGDSDYTTKQNEPVPVHADEEIEGNQDTSTQDAGKQLEQDDKDAIDKSNILKDRTRGAAPTNNSYEEPEDLNAEDAEAE